MKKIPLTLGIDAVFLVALAVITSIGERLPPALGVPLTLLLAVGAYGYAKQQVWRLLARKTHAQYWLRTVALALGLGIALWLLTWLTGTVFEAPYRAYWALLILVGLPLAAYFLLPWIQVAKPKKGYVRALGQHVMVQAVLGLILALLLTSIRAPRAVPTALGLFLLVANAYNRSKL